MKDKTMRRIYFQQGVKAGVDQLDGRAYVEVAADFFEGDMINYDELRSHGFSERAIQSIETALWTEVDRQTILRVVADAKV